MSDWYPGFYSEFKTLIQTTWPEITDAQFFTSIQALQKNIVDSMERGDLSVSGYAAPPYAVLMIGSSTNDDNWGLQNRIKRNQVTVWYIDKIRDRDNQQFLEAKVWALGEAVDGTDHTTFEQVETASYDSSESNSANDAFLEGKISLQAASASWTPGFITGDTG